MVMGYRNLEAGGRPNEVEGNNMGPYVVVGNTTISTIPLGTLITLDTYTLPDYADTNLPLKLAYKSDKAMEAIVRISAMNADGSVEVDTGLIENRINHGS